MRGKLIFVRLRSLLGACTLVLSSLSSSCTHYVQRGEALYREHRYIEAAEAFERTEDRLARSSTEERAEYGLYRGLTFLYLDDLASARTWLGYARSIVQRAPSSLQPEERSLLERGFQELEQRTRSTGTVRLPATRVANAEPAAALRAARAPGNGRRSVTPE